MMQAQSETRWVWVNTYRYIFSGMNIHLPAILGFTRYQGFDPSPDAFKVSAAPVGGKTQPSHPALNLHRSGSQ